MLPVCVDSIILIIHQYSFVFLEIVVTCYILLNHNYSNKATQLPKPKKLEMVMLTSSQDFTLLF